MRGSALVGALVLAAVPAAASAGPAHTAVKPAAKAFPFLADYYKLAPAERSRFALAYRLQDGGRRTPVRMVLLDAGAATPLPTSPDGWLTKLPAPAAFARGATVRVDVPADAKIGVSMVPEVVLKAGELEVSAADLAAAAVQVAAVTRKVAGPLSFVAPKFTRVVFSGAEGAVAVDAGGRATVLPLDDGAAVFDLARASGVRSVRFSRAPYHALLVPPAK